MVFRWILIDLRELTLAWMLTGRVIDIGPLLLSNLLSAATS